CMVDAFFFQAEDGIRDRNVTGVQTCALPIFMVAPALVNLGVYPLAAHLFIFYFGIISAITPPVALASIVAAGIAEEKPLATSLRSEERRVGKECRSRRATYNQQEKE